MIGFQYDFDAPEGVLCCVGLSDGGDDDTGAAHDGVVEVVVEAPENCPLVTTPSYFCFGRDELVPEINEIVLM